MDCKAQSHVYRQFRVKGMNGEWCNSNWFLSIHWRKRTFRHEVLVGEQGLHTFVLHRRGLILDSIRVVVCAENPVISYSRYSRLAWKSPSILYWLAITNDKVADLCCPCGHKALHRWPIDSSYIPWLILPILWWVGTHIATALAKFKSYTYCFDTIKEEDSGAFFPRLFHLVLAQPEWPRVATWCDRCKVEVILTPWLVYDEAKYARKYVGQVDINICVFFCRFTLSSLQSGDLSHWRYLCMHRRMPVVKQQLTACIGVAFCIHRGVYQKSIESFWLTINQHNMQAIKSTFKKRLYFRKAMISFSLAKISRGCNSYHGINQINKNTLALLPRQLEIMSMVEFPIESDTIWTNSLLNRVLYFSLQVVN